MSTPNPHKYSLHNNDQGGPTYLSPDNPNSNPRFRNPKRMVGNNEKMKREISSDYRSGPTKIWTAEEIKNYEMGLM
jgi:hypothetical protein